MNKRILSILLLPMLALWGCAQTAHASQTLNVALFRLIPNYEAFEDTVREQWHAIHPETELNFIDWNCYGSDVPENLDVFVFDTINLDLFAGKGCLLPISEEDIRDYDDLIPAIVEDCRVDGRMLVVPQLLCTDLLYTRKADKAMRNVQSIYDLSDVLGDEGLLMDNAAGIAMVGMYLQAFIDSTQTYMDSFPPFEAETLSQEAIESLREIESMLEFDPDNAPGGGGLYDNVQRFAEGMGDAYIGYSESMDIMGESASDMQFRLFSMTRDSNIPVFYVDAAAINAHIPEEKKAIALDLLNMITGRDLMVAASGNGGDPRYLLSARYSVYDAMAADFPIYSELKEIASVPNAHVFRIKPDGDAYLQQAIQNISVLQGVLVQ